MGKTIVLLGTLDTKGVELNYLREHIKQRGYNTIVVDGGIRGRPAFEPDITREQVAQAVGAKIEEVAVSGGEAKAVETMAGAVARVAEELYRTGKLDGIISVGGSLGTTIGTAAMRALPFGVPKVMVSSMASGDTRPYVQTKDLVMIHSVTDVSGLNRMTKKVLVNAAGAIEGMVAATAEEQPEEQPEDKRLIAITTLGGTNAGADVAKAIFEQQGYEVVVFHAIGTGGQALEEAAEQGLVDGVLDLALDELSAHFFGGLMDAGPLRLEAAGKKGIPQVVVPGVIDIVPFNVEAVPENFKDRKLIKHNPFILVAPLNTEEMTSLARVVAQKLNKATGPTAVIIPTQGFSPGGKKGRAYHDPERDRAFIDVLKESLRPDITFVEVEAHVNDAAFAEQAASLLIRLMQQAN